MDPNQTPAHRDVSTWIEGARAPVDSKDFKHESQAKAFAENRRDVIRRSGSCHKVRVTPVFTQA